MSSRNILLFGLLTGAAVGSWYLAQSDRAVEVDDRLYDREYRGYYIKAARILGTREDGSLLYEIRAEEAEQQADERIEFTDIEIRYSPSSDVPWTVVADEGTIREGSPRITLRGHVSAVSGAEDPDRETEIRTQYLELDPDRFIAETDDRVQIRIGARSLTATGMLASLNDDRLELKSNVSGKFVP